MEKKLCLNCGKELKNKINKFCNSSCSATYNNLHKVLIPKYCINCGKVLEKEQRQVNKYCSSKCMSQYRKKEKINQWISGEFSGSVDKKNYNLSRYVRNYLIELSNNKCSRCGWGEVNIYTGKCLLEIHHITGDWKDNSKENLCVLCPNCHSLTETYKNLNMGNGRPYRKL